MTSAARIVGVGHVPGRGQPSRSRSLLAKVHLARKELGLAEEDYRAVLVRVTGHGSARDCTDAELIAVIEEFKAKGWKPAQPAGRGRSRPADHPGAGKARAMWISLHQLGAIDNPSEQALEAFARRQLRCERLQWANQSLTFRLIEALKAIAERHGWRQDLAGIPPHATVIVLKRRLIDAIAGKLWQAALVPLTWDVNRIAAELLGEDIELLFATGSELDQVAKAMGDRLRDGDRAAELVR